MSHDIGMSDLLTRIESMEMRRIMAVGRTKRKDKRCHATIRAADTTPLLRAASSCPVGDDNERRCTYAGAFDRREVETMVLVSQVTMTNDEVRALELGGDDEQKKKNEDQKTSDRSQE